MNAVFLYYIQTALQMVGSTHGWLTWLSFLNFTPQDTASSSSSNVCPMSLSAYQQMGNEPFTLTSRIQSMCRNDYSIAHCYDLHSFRWSVAPVHFICSFTCRSTRISVVNIFCHLVRQCTRSLSSIQICCSSTHTTVRCQQLRSYVGCTVFIQLYAGIVDFASFIMNYFRTSSPSLPSLQHHLTVVWMFLFFSFFHAGDWCSVLVSSLCGCW